MGSENGFDGPFKYATILPTRPASPCSSQASRCPSPCPSSGTGWRFEQFKNIFTPLGLRVRCVVRDSGLHPFGPASVHTAWLTPIRARASAEVAPGEKIEGENAERPTGCYAAMLCCQDGPTAMARKSKSEKRPGTHLKVSEQGERAYLLWCIGRATRRRARAAARPPACRACLRN